MLFEIRGLPRSVQLRYPDLVPSSEAMERGEAIYWPRKGTRRWKLKQFRIKVLLSSRPHRRISRDYLHRIIAHKPYPIRTTRQHSYSVLRREMKYGLLFQDPVTHEYTFTNPDEVEHDPAVYY